MTTQEVNLMLQLQRELSARFDRRHDAHSDCEESDTNFAQRTEKRGECQRGLAKWGGNRATRPRIG